jgi:hypothetical protein
MAVETYLFTYDYSVVMFMFGKKETEVLQLAPIIIYSKQWIFIKL